MGIFVTHSFLSAAKLTLWIFTYSSDSSRRECCLSFPFRRHAPKAVALLFLIKLFMLGMLVYRCHWRIIKLRIIVLKVKVMLRVVNFKVRVTHSKEEKGEVAVVVDRAKRVVEDDE